MKKGTKAILYSAFIFPGSGHLLLHKRVLGWVLIGAASGALIAILAHVIESTQQIVERVQSGEVPPDLVIIRQLVAEQQATSSTWVVEAAFVILVISWLVGIIDSYRISKLGGIPS